MRDDEGVDKGFLVCRLLASSTGRDGENGLENGGQLEA